VTATCLGAALATLIMAFYSNYPFALAPGMGLNAFLVFGVIIGMKFPWQVGMAVIFIEGLIIAFIGLNQGGIILPALITMVTLGDFTQP